MRLICGIGINDSEVPVTRTHLGAEAGRSIEYRAWTNMLNRCYSEKFQEMNKSYRGVTVCEEWHRFSNFKCWHDEHYVEGWHLDKDLLTDSREYGPSTCVFVPGWLNTFLGECNKTPKTTGASWRGRERMFVAYCNNTIKKKKEALGYFTTQEAAHRAWLDRKVELAYQLKDLMDAIDRRIYFMVIERIFSANHRPQ